MNRITAIVLAGGRGERMDGEFKPLLKLGEKTLLDHVLDALRPQVERIIVACSASGADRLADLGLETVVDEAEDQGPIAGIQAALGSVTSPWILLSPADTPFLPPDLVKTLGASFGHIEPVNIALPRTPTSRQSLSALMTRYAARSLVAYYEAGGRSIKRWLDDHPVHEVAMPEHLFLNINTEADLAKARQRVLDADTINS